MIGREAGEREKRRVNCVSAANYPENVIKSIWEMRKVINATRRDITSKPTSCLTSKYWEREKRLRQKNKQNAESA